MIFYDIAMDCFKTLFVQQESSAVQVFNDLVPSWLKNYRREDISGDLVAGLIVFLLLVPQGLAYALLAGLPLSAGLYGAFIPLIIYAFFGSSRQQSVGPMAVTALMTAAAIAPLAELGTLRAYELALGLAILSGGLLILFSFFKMGWLAYYLSQPVIIGFTCGSVILIIVSQASALLGISLKGHNLILLFASFFDEMHNISLSTCLLSLASLWILIFGKKYLKALLKIVGLADNVAALVVRLLPAMLVLGSIALTSTLGWHERFAWKVVGEIPSGMPTLSLPSLSFSDWQMLLLPALLLAFMNFVQSYAVAQALAQKNGETISANRELLGLGVANVAAGLSSGMPVTGGLSRSALNAAAGAKTQLSSIISGLLLGSVLLFGTGFLHTLPYAVLAATIVTAVWNMFQFEDMRRIWHYDRTDAWAMLASFLAVLLLGVAESILLGVLCSLGFTVWRFSHPHIAEIGRLPNSLHFRNRLRYTVQTLPQTMFLRIDEHLHFANIHDVDARMMAMIAARSAQNPPNLPLKNVVLVMSAVNGIDASAFDRLWIWQTQLAAQGLRLHFAEIKGPVFDRLQRADFEQQCQGKIFLSCSQAWAFFAADVVAAPDFVI